MFKAYKKFLVGNDDKALEAITILAKKSYELQLFAVSEKYSRAHTNRLRQFDESEVELAKALEQQGRCLGMQQKYEESVECFREAVELWAEHEPEGLPHVNALRGLIITFGRQGRNDQRDKVIAELVEVSLRSGMHETTVIKHVERYQKYGLSKPLREKLVVDARVKRPIDLAVALFHLGVNLEKQDKFPEAELVYRERLAIERQIESTGQGVTASLLSLAQVLFKQQKNTEATQLVRERINLLRLRFVSDQPELYKLLSNDAVTFWGAGEYSSSTPLFQEILDYSKARLGENNPATLKKMYRLGRSHLSAENFDEAIRVFERLLLIRRGILQPNSNSEMRLALKYLAEAYAGADRTVDAIRVRAEHDRLEEVNARLEQAREAAKKHIDSGRWEEAQEPTRQVLSVTTNYLDFCRFATVFLFARNTSEFRSTREVFARRYANSKDPDILNQIATTCDLAPYIENEEELQSLVCEMTARAVTTGSEALRQSYELTNALSEYRRGKYPESRQLTRTGQRNQAFDEWTPWGVKRDVLLLMIDIEEERDLLDAERRIGELQH